MELVVRATQYLNDLLFVGLAIIAMRQWRRSHDQAAAWVMATFCLLAGISMVSLVLPEDLGETSLGLWVVKVLLLTIVAFPYLLYRFATIFEPVGRRVELLARALTGLVVIATMLLPSLPEPGAPRSRAFGVFVGVLLVQWTTLSSLVVFRLWRGGRGKPSVARMRMRVLSVASLVLNLGIVVSAMSTSTEEATVQSVVTGLMTTLSAVLFFGAFAPPSIVRLVWRRPEEQALREAQLGLMSATSASEVTALVLPSAARAVGATRAALIDHCGAVLGAYAPPGSEGIQPDPGDVPIRLSLAAGELVLWATPHAPYFGREEITLLESFGLVVDLALARCQLLEQHRTTSARLQESQAIAHIAGWEWDVDADVLTWSDELFRILGRGPSDLDLEGFVDLVSPSDRDLVASSMRTAALSGSDFGLDHRVVRDDGVERVLHTQGSAQTDAGGHVRIVGTAQDVTERKEAEDQLAEAFGREKATRLALEGANADLEAFVYSVSHDLKSPIISLLGYLEYLKLDFGDILPPDAERYVDRMSASANYMQDLIQGLLELSRVGRMDSSAAAVDFTEVMHEVIAEVGDSHPNLSVRMSPLPVLRLNPLRVRQLLTNLVSNAAEHGGTGPVVVEVSSWVEADRSVVVKVSDDGRGIAPEYREKVFGLFERLEDAGTAGGTGIGLAICRRIVESVGGSISVAGSTKGTCMRMEFPATTLVRAPAEPGIGALL